MWKRRESSKGECRNRKLTDLIRTTYLGSQKTYGSPRIYKALKAESICSSSTKFALQIIEKALFIDEIITMENLILKISTRLKIYLPSAEVFMNFEEIRVSEFSGFYDWLRNNSGDVLGVRIWMNQSNAVIASGMLGKPYVFIDKDASWSIFFSEKYSPFDVEENISADQDFFSMDFYKNKSGEEILIVIDCSSLNDTEKQTVKQLLNYV